MKPPENANAKIDLFAAGFGVVVVVVIDDDQDVVVLDVIVFIVIAREYTRSFKKIFTIK